ncbi:MAG: nucleotide exchange factor GrpE [Acidobacteriota bacterium]
MEEQDNKIEVGYVPDENGENTKPDTEKKEMTKKTETKKRVSLKKLQTKLKDQEKVLGKLIDERNDLKDKYLRNLAEVDNFRKRIKKEKEEYQKYFLADFLKELLVVIDNLERALSVKNTETDDGSIISGVEMIYKQFTEILKKNNVIEIESLNKPFDPNIHQALSKVEHDDVAEAVIVEIYQKGFMYNDKLLRPVLAKVAIPLEEDEVEEGS